MAEYHGAARAIGGCAIYVRCSLHYRTYIGLMRATRLMICLLMLGIYIIYMQ